MVTAASGGLGGSDVANVQPVNCELMDTRCIGKPLSVDSYLLLADRTKVGRAARLYSPFDANRTVAVRAALSLAPKNGKLLVVISGFSFGAAIIIECGTAPPDGSPQYRLDRSHKVIALLQREGLRLASRVNSRPK